MNLEIIAIPALASLEPLTCRMAIGDVPVGRGTLRSELATRLAAAESAAGAAAAAGLAIRINSNFWPSAAMAAALVTARTPLRIQSADGRSLASAVPAEADAAKAVAINVDGESREIVYPWQILDINEELLAALRSDDIRGEIRSGATVDGHIVLGVGSVLLPGVYIEGNAVIGDNCKIGPNCYIRQYTRIGDNCHVGNAVEIKNSILMNKVAAGHLSYIGDSIACPFVNFGAGTITANFRHDGKNHRSTVDGELIDTGRRKFGSIIGEHVHTGIHTGIYPGRKIWPDMATRPGIIVERDLKP